MHLVLYHSTSLSVPISLEAVGEDNLIDLHRYIGGRSGVQIQSVLRL